MEVQMIRDCNESFSKNKLYVFLVTLIFMVSCQKGSVDKKENGHISQPVIEKTFPKDAPDPARWNRLLSGTWKFSPEETNDFQPVPVPCFWDQAPQAKKVGWKSAQKWKSGTFQRSFDLPDDMTGAILDFEMIRWGGQVFVNEKSAGKYNLGYSPAIFDVSSLVKKSENKVTVKARGWKSLERYEGKDIQIPTGAGNWFGRKTGGIPGDVYLRLYNNASIGSLRIVPKMAGPSCDLSANITSLKSAWSGALAAQVLSEDGKTAYSEVYRTKINLKSGASSKFEIKNIVAPSAKLWWQESPNLYRLVVWLEADNKKVVAVRDDVFGFRELNFKNGNFYLNNRRTALFGSSTPIKFELGLFKKMNANAQSSLAPPLP